MDKGQNFEMINIELAANTKFFVCGGVFVCESVSVLCLIRTFFESVLSFFSYIEGGKRDIFFMSEWMFFVSGVMLHQGSNFQLIS